MATTWIKALHVVKGKSVAQTLADRTDYAKNPEKTAKGKLTSLAVAKENVNRLLREETPRKNRANER